MIDIQKGARITIPVSRYDVICLSLYLSSSSARNLFRIFLQSLRLLTDPNILVTMMNSKEMLSFFTMSLSSFTLMASFNPVPVGAFPSRVQVGHSNMKADAMHSARGASVDDIQHQLKKRNATYISHPWHLPFILRPDHILAQPSLTAYGIIPQTQTLFLNSLTTAFAPPVPVQATKRVSLSTNATPS